jgi:hypothetical protein
MAKATTTVNFSDGDQVTSTTLDQIIGGFSLAADSVDGVTITQSSGVLSLGVAGAANIGADAVTTIKILDANVAAAKLATDAVETAKIKDLNVTGAKIAETTIGFSKTLTADRAAQADMQSETASHFVSPDVLKYHHGVSKAGAVLTMADGTYAGAYNISGTATGTSTSRTVTIPTMANSNYRVNFSQEDSGTTANAPVITAKTTTTFTVASGANKIAFDVFGQLA